MKMNASQSARQSQYYAERDRVDALQKEESPDGMRQRVVPHEDDRRNNHLVNLTPHEVVIQLDAPENFTLRIPPRGTVARVSVTLRRIGLIDGVPTVVGVYGPVVDLPALDPEIHVNYIVSAMVRAALPTRLDLVSPAEFVRDGAGKIVGCKALEINPVA